MKDKFDRYADVIIDFLKGKEDWTTLRLKEIACKIDSNTVYATETVERLRNHPDIKVEEDMSVSSGRKPLKFLYVGAKPVKETKVFSKSYKNLTEEEVAFIEKMSSDNNKINKPILLSVINVIAGLGGRDNYILNYNSQISDLLIMTYNNVKFQIDLARWIGLVNIKHESIKLTIDPISQAKNVSIPVATSTCEVAPTVGKTPTVEEIKNTVVPTIETITFIAKPSTTIEKVKQVELSSHESDTENIEKAIAMYETMVTNLDDFQDFMKSFQGFFDKTATDMKQITVTGNTKELEKELEMGSMAMSKCLEENKCLRAANVTKDKKIVELNKLAQAYRADSDRVFDFIHERFQILIAETMNHISEYAQMPDWRRNASENAKFQNAVVNAITSSTDEILKAYRDSSIKAFN
jgi:hypothetical protein